MRHVLFGQPRPRTLKRLFLGFFVAVIAVTSVLTPLNTYAKTESEMNLVERTQSYVYLNAVRKCIADSSGHLIDNTVAARRDRISVDDVRSGNWFQNNTGFDIILGDPYRVAASYLNENTDTDTDTDQGLALCNSVLKDALGLWGYSDGLEFMCDSIGFRANNSSCETGSGDFGQIHPYEDRFYRAIIEKVYDGNEPSLLETVGGQGRYPGRYLLYLRAFEKGCQAVESSSPASNFRYADIRIVDEEGNVEEITYEGINRGDRRNVYVGRDGLNVVQPTCAQIADEVNNYAADYRAYRLANPEEPTTGTGDTSFECQGENPPASCTDGSSPTCSIDGIGWIICPVLQFAADITDQLYNFLADSFLQVDVSLFDTSNENAGTYAAWTIMRNLANVAFVIVFLIIIFSQLTSLGVSNYGVKKLLPRIVVAAILVNISFFLCQIAVDLSNIAGYGLKSLFESIGGGLNTATPLPANGDVSGDGVTWGVITGLVIGAAAIGTGYVALGSLIAVLAAALVSILVIFFILIVRQVLIVLLIVLAPLAFVAYLLPNTESLFTKWRKLFISLLMVFPVIGLVYGASSLASQVLGNVYSNAANGLDTTVGQIIAGGALIIPLIAVPFILKASLDGFGKLGSMINNIGNKASGAAGKAAGNRFDTSRLGKFQKYRKQQREINRALTQSGAYAGRNPIRQVLSKANKGINSNLGRFGDSLAAGGVGLARETEEKAAKEQATLLRSQIASGVMTNDKLNEEAAKAFRSGDRVKTKAIQDVMFEQGGGGMNRYTEAVRKAQSTSGGMSPASFEAMRENINTKHGQLVKTKAMPLSKLAGIGGKLDDHASDIGTWALSAGDLAGQTGAQLQYAADRKLINPEIARAMMKDDRIRERLDPEQQSALTKAAQETKQSYEQLVIEADTKKKKAAQDTAFATYESAGNVETYRQAGEAKVEEAAQGSAGTTPFVVDSGGSVTSNTVSGRAKSTQVESSNGQAGEGVFVVSRSGETEAPTPPAPSVLDVNPDAAQRVADLNNPYRTMDQSQPAPINPADTSNIFGSSTTSINVPVTVPPEPIRAPNPFSTMDQPSPQNPVDPADISTVTGQSTNESINIPLSDEEKK